MATLVGSSVFGVAVVFELKRRVDLRFILVLSAVGCRHFECFGTYLALREFVLVQLKS